MSTMKETMPKQDKEGKVPAETVNHGRRRAMRKLAYAPPTLISLGLIKEASAQLGSPPCVPNDPRPECQQ